MTLEDAKKMYNTNLEITELKRELKELEEERKYYKATILTDMPKGSSHEYTNIADKYLIKQQELKDMLKYSMNHLLQGKLEFEKAVKEIDDSELRIILRLRCMNNMRWEEIGEKIGVDRRTASRKFYHYFNEVIEIK